MEKYDFSGWATRNDLKCSDGRTIRRDAFKECDGQKVPLVWSHVHNDPEMVLGHAILYNNPEGVYMEGKLNDTPKGQVTKQLIENGDVVGLSIWANNLVQKGGDVLHGVIREVSVVLSGANPGAYIDNVVLSHGELSEGEDEAVMYYVPYDSEEAPHLAHADKEDDDEEKEPAKEEKKEEEPPVKNDFKEEPKGETEMAEKNEVNTNPKDDDEETVEDVFNTLSEKQKTVVYALIGEALKDAGADEDEEEDEDEDYEEDEDVKHNVFESAYDGTDFLSHEDMTEIINDAKRIGSLREALEDHLEGGVLAHAIYNHDADGNQTTEQTYGIADINYLFPDARTINATPEFIKRKDEWVGVVINGTHHTPFSRVKSVFANITEDEARAKGYIKGKHKKNEVFSLLKRATDPQTVYKYQKMDRDDIVDITDFDVIAWLRAEMRLMLDEEIARAILIGDGRLTSDEAHISEDHVRPVATDADLYTIKAEVATGKDNEETAKNMIKAAIRARKDYQGSGSPVMFAAESWITEMMLLEDGLGHPLYVDEAALARRMRVSRIVPCPVMEGYKIENKTVYGIIVNLKDYNVGADKGGEVNSFEDFDIKFNQHEYLIETRMSGALIRPYSAIVLKEAAANSSTTEPEG